MEYVNIGKYINTHGIKGEIRILSDFSAKELVFKKGMPFYIGKDRQKLIVNSYRPHKNFDMVTFEGISNMNEVLNLKGSLVYVAKEDIESDSYIMEDLVGYTVIYNNKNIGVLNSFMKTKAHDLLVINDNVYIPYVSEFIENVDTSKKEITVKNAEGLINEN